MPQALKEKLRSEANSILDREGIKCRVVSVTLDGSLGAMYDLQGCSSSEEDKKARLIVNEFLSKRLAGLLPKDMKEP